MENGSVVSFARAGGREERRKAAFRLLYYFVAIFVLSFLLVFPLIVWQGLDELKKISLIEKAGTTFAIVAVIVFLRIKTGDRLALFGLGGPHGLRNFVLGLIGGMSFLGAELGGMNLLGGYSFGTVTAGAAMLERSALVNAVLFLLVGFSEELTWRGYAQVQLSRIAGFWPAILVWSAVFGISHLPNPGENWIGALAVLGFGLVFAISFRLTGSLWFAFGLHSAWDYAETFLFGVPDSGFPAKDALLHPSFHGPNWLTGGSVGPEGSILVIAPLLAILGASWILRAKTSVTPASGR